MNLFISSILVLPFLLFVIPKRLKHSFFISLLIISLIPLCYLAYQVISTGIVMHLRFSLAGIYSPVLELDSLASFFILTISFTVLTGSLYAREYIRREEQHSSITGQSLHYLSLIWLYFSMVFICLVRDSFGFLIGWEIMSISSFILVIHKLNDRAVLSAGINYLVQMHISFIFLLSAFLLIQSKTGISGFEGISRFSSLGYGVVPVYLFFIGFGIKAGFVPFHSWLPEAHPAAPSHVSGIMSGVMIKMGIYGILRVIGFMNTGLLEAGLIVLAISLISSVYGVMQAILQHDLKRLLAWHSIENIGIIGIGIGLGLIGQAKSMPVLAFLGYTGAILHVLNHSLFKSLLFYTAGSVYLATGTRIMNRLGGLIKKMPVTGLLFLLAAIAICGLPPLNGFVSEFLIFSGLFESLKSLQPSFIIIFIITITGLALTGGLALFCFSKAFGISFLGKARHEYSQIPADPGYSSLIPQITIGITIVLIGLIPVFFVKWVGTIVHSSFGLIIPANLNGFSLATLNGIQYTGILFLVIFFLIYGLRKYLLSGRKKETEPTWACGYTAGNVNMQYTATSFASDYARISNPLIGEVREYKKETEEIVFPAKRTFSVHSYDHIKTRLIDSPVNFTIRRLKRMAVFQTGKMQHYIMYALVFLLLCIILSLKNLI